VNMLELISNVVVVVDSEPLTRFIARMRIIDDVLNERLVGRFSYVLRYFTHSNPIRTHTRTRPSGPKRPISLMPRLR
jgi:hypothetical protein